MHEEEATCEVTASILVLPQLFSEGDRFTAEMIFFIFLCFSHTQSWLSCKCVFHALFALPVVVLFIYFVCE